MSAILGGLRVAPAAEGPAPLSTLPGCSHDWRDKATLRAIDNGRVMHACEQAGPMDGRRSVPETPIASQARRFQCA